jgi:inner membrane protein
MAKLAVLIKTLIVFFLSLILLIPLAMIRGTILERQSYREEAIRSVETSYAGQQIFAGPVIIVPYEDEQTVITLDAKNQQVQEQVVSKHFWTIYPYDLSMSGQLEPTIRKLGLHEVRVYAWKGKLKTNFTFINDAPSDPKITRRIGNAYISFMMKDVRGLQGKQLLKLNNQEVSLQQGSGPNVYTTGVHADIENMELGKEYKIPVELDFTLAGTERLAIVPMGTQNNISINSSWPHPNFGGSFLPANRSIDAKGFKANWDISSLSASAQQQFRSKTPLEQMDALELKLVEPVNIYTQADRASKYGFLFVALTFAGFFMFELIKRLSIHPVQYGLVGLSLAIFFLLLISLSEHIAFSWSYLIASVSCIGLLSVYLSSVLKGWFRSIGFSSMLTVLYGALYGLLVSEDNALVLGSILMFIILAAVMLITRNVDWYKLGQKEAGDSQA